MTTYTAPPDQVNGLTLNQGDTLTVAQGATVSGITVNGGGELVDGTTENTTFRAGLIEIGTGGKATLTIPDGAFDRLMIDNATDNSLGPLTLDFGQSTIAFKFPGKQVTNVETDIFDGVGDISVQFASGPLLHITYFPKGGDLTLLPAQMSDSPDTFVLDVVPAITTTPPFSPETAGTIVYSGEYGSAPDASELNVLHQFAQAQFAYGQQIGVTDPAVYAFQSLGVALASTATNFQNTFGPAVDGDVQFVVDAYASVFGQAGSGAQIQHFADQLNYFEALYTAAGTFGSPSNIDLLARGAVYGQMLGIEHESTLIGTPEGGTTFTAPPDQTHLKLGLGDILNINSQGVAKFTTVDPLAVVNVGDGGKALDTTIVGAGTVNVLNGGAAIDTTLGFGGTLNVLSGGTADNVNFVADATVNLASPLGLEGTINPGLGGFVDFQNTNVVSAQEQTGDKLTVTYVTNDGHVDTATYKLSTDFGLQLQLQSDHHGGTTLTLTVNLPAPTSHHDVHDHMVGRESAEPILVGIIGAAHAHHDLYGHL